MSTAQVIPPYCSPSEVEVYFNNACARHDLKDYYTPPPQDRPESEQGRLGRWTSMLKLFTPSDRETISLEEFVVKERIEEGLLDMCKSQGVPYRAPAFMESSNEFRQRRKGILDALDMPEKKRGGMTNGTPNSKRLPQVPTVTPESGSSFARSIIEREQEEVELAVMCKLLEIAYIPPAERETKEQTLERRELLRGWCREYENKKKPAVAASRKKKSLHPTVPPFAAMPAGGRMEAISLRNVKPLKRLKPRHRLLRR